MTSWAPAPQPTCLSRMFPSTACLTSRFTQPLRRSVWEFLTSTGPTSIAWSKLSAKAEARRRVQRCGGFQKYPQLPTTFDGSLPSDNLRDKPRPMIGETYLFEGVANLPASVGGNLVATVTTATVLESEKTAYIGVTDQNGRSHILSEPMTDQQLADYKAHPEPYFGRIQHVGHKIGSKYELFEFLMESI